MDFQEVWSQESPPVSKASKRVARKAEKEARRPKALEARNSRQKALIQNLNSYPVVIALGSAGTGKTYVTARHSLNRLLQQSIKRIVIARPTVSAPRHRMGFLPGTGNQKMKPWLVPIVDAFREGTTAAEVERLLANGAIEVLPFEHMRGRTIKDGVFLLDEAQNCSFGDLEMFLTRVGENAQVVICGDPDQSDIPDSGLNEIVKLAEHYEANAGIVRFLPEDVVRSATAAEWVKIFDERRKQRCREDIPLDHLSRNS
jgi:phosphate starvation-inducible PhoH-like protein